jgi:hypothetical protein
MSRKPQPPLAERAPAPPLVPCHRVDRLKTPAQHHDCPYCFGSLEQIRDGAHAAFCGYDPERDPTVFGFPPAFGRFHDA